MQNSIENFACNSLDEARHRDEQLNSQIQRNACHDPAGPLRQRRHRLNWQFRKLLAKAGKESTG